MVYFSSILYLMLKNNIVLSLLICLLFFISYGQVDSKFLDKNDYLEYVGGKHSINSSSIYYISNLSTSRAFIFPSFTYFLKGGKMVTIDEVSEKLDPTCSTNKLFKQISCEFIEDLLIKKNTNFDIVFKNLKKGEILEEKEKIIAVFLFSVHLKKLGTKYIKHRERLEELGINTIVLSMDMPDIEGVDDYSKINQIRFKKNKL
jgi:hypothetical protein